MNIKIKTYKKIRKSLIKDIYTLSKLMEDEYKEEVLGRTFSIIHQYLKGKNGTFFIGYYNNQKVSFGILAHGISDPEFKRLKYFAVKKDSRNKSIGLNTLKKLISLEINLTSGCGLTCSHELLHFYSKLGFRKVQTMKKENISTSDGIILDLNEDTSLYENNKDYGNFQDIQITEPDAFVTYKQLENQYNIKLMPNQDT